MVGGSSLTKASTKCLRLTRSTVVNPKPLRMKRNKAKTVKMNIINKNSIFLMEMMMKTKVAMNNLN
jgi:hypothetical protein